MMTRYLLIALAIIPLACGASPVIKQQVRLLTKLSISYPDAARAAGHQGTVRLRLSINTEGRIEDVEVVESSRSAVLDAAAVEQAKALTLPPAINVEDKPVSGMRLYNLFLGCWRWGPDHTPRRSRRRWSVARTSPMRSTGTTYNPG